MVKEIIEGISIALDAEFNGNGITYKFYTDNVKQGLDTPCFLITIVGPSQSNLIAGRYNGVCPACIQYFPLNDGDNTEMHAIAEKMLNCLEVITLINQDKVRGNDMHYEIVDSVVNFFVDYSVGLKTQSQQNRMDGASVNTGLK